MSTALKKQRACSRMTMAHLVKEVLDEDWSATTAAFRLRVLVGENLGVLHRMRARLRQVATRRQDGPTRRALATLDVAVGKPNQEVCGEALRAMVSAGAPAWSSSGCMGRGRATGAEDVEAIRGI